MKMMRVDVPAAVELQAAAALLGSAVQCPTDGKFLLVVAALFGLVLSSAGAQADAQGPFGGPGGGTFRTVCDPGAQVTGFDTMEKNGVIVRIAPVCGTL